MITNGNNQSSQPPPQRQPSSRQSRTFTLRDGFSFFKALGIGTAGLVGTSFFVVIVAMIAAGTANPFIAIGKAKEWMLVDPEITLLQRSAEIERCTSVLSVALEQQRALFDYGQRAFDLSSILAVARSIIDDLNAAIALLEKNPLKAGFLAEKAREQRQKLAEERVQVESIMRTAEYIFMLRNGGQLGSGNGCHMGTASS